MRFLLFFIATIYMGCFAAASSSSSSSNDWETLLAEISDFAVRSAARAAESSSIFDAESFSEFDAIGLSLPAVASSSISDAASFSMPAALPSLFAQKVRLLERKSTYIIHPLLHGRGEMRKQGLFAQVGAAGIKMCEGDTNAFADVWKKNLPAIKAHSKGMVSSIFSNWFGKDINTLLLGEDFYTPKDASGSATMQALLDAENGIARRFPNWNEERDCPNGIARCPKLGANSKILFTGIQQFIGNIAAYENKRRQPYFTEDAEVYRIMIFLNFLTQRISEVNIVQAALSKEGSLPDDKELKPYINVLNYLISLPTKVHNIRKHWSCNSIEIDKLFSNFDEKEQKELFEFLGVLLQRSEDPNYGYKQGDAGLNLILAGPTGTGKTFTTEWIIRRLGFRVIKVSAAELREGQNRSYNDIAGLVDDRRLSGVEKNFLHLAMNGKKGIGKLNHVLFVDEADAGRQHFSAGWKDQLDQFKKWRMPSLGITLPAHQTIIFTTNAIDMVNHDAALQGRFWRIVFKEMSPDKKVEILSNALGPKIAHKPHLMQKRATGEFAAILKRYVNFGGKPADLRVLLANLDNVVFFFDRRHHVASGELYLLPPSERKGAQETFEEFLTRKFGPRKEQLASSPASSSVVGEGDSEEGLDSDRYDTSADESFGDDYGNSDSE